MTPVRPPVPSTTPRSGRERIVLVDHATDRSKLSELVDAFASGRYAVIRLRMDRGAIDDIVKLAPDLVLVDHESVEPGTAQLCRDVHVLTTSRIVVVVPAVAPDEVVVEMLDAGADDVVGSDVAPEVLLARLRAASRGLPTRRPARRVLTLGDVVVDLDAHSVRVAGAPLRLAPLHFDLLVLLAEHEGTIMTTDDLLLRIWGADRGELTTRRLRIAVSWLRKALGDGPLRPTIRTVHSVGYRLDTVPAPSRPEWGHEVTVA